MHSACVCVDCVDSDIVVHTDTTPFAPSCSLPIGSLFPRRPRKMWRQREAGGDGMGGMGSSLTLLTPPPFPGGGGTTTAAGRSIVEMSRERGGAKDGGKQGREEEEAGRGRCRAGRRSLVSDAPGPPKMQPDGRGFEAI